ncbi:cupin-like domain-containing protein [Thalassotalea sp. PS06]|uniref:cupin-like domain-containing protein n=1 Tax=Thalassotalea sp. PS06 TaxID=2594005 RepID=UPI001162A0B5|nr:cupin-like domain-containing protein [Thalassotalea sp. PS06]QDP00463.1 cupin-like domain-containing protein [Thalassotalea sp. PS06]
MLDINSQVKEIEGITLDDIPEAVFASEQPLILKGAARHWPLVEAGMQSAADACDYLRTLYTGNPVIACYGDPEINGRVFYNDTFDGFNYRASKIDLNPVLDKLLSHADESESPTMYVGSTEVTRFLPGFKEAHSIDLEGHQALTSIWIGNQSRIAAHFDFPHNIAVSAVGRRRFTLFPPDQIHNLYVGPMDFAPGGQDISLVDFAAPDLQKYPKFADAIEAAQVAELDAGDALYLPSMWWHHVEALDPINMLVTHWWRDSPGFMGRPNNALLLAILSIRSLPKAQRKAWQQLFNHYIFEHDEVGPEHFPTEKHERLELPLQESTARRIRAELIEKLKR